jgi:ribulose-bisphosphate carboxylase large chain
MTYLNLRYKPSSNDLICDFLVKPARGVSVRKAAENIALESSTGTWTELTTSNERMEKISAKAFQIKGKRIRIAYPLDLFEPGNIPQLLSSVAGNIFGMKLIDRLRLEDIEFPARYVKSFPGPEVGLEDLRRIMKIHGRPIIGTIFKPKLGLNPKEQAKLAYQVYTAGLDYTKDDENLTSMSFNKFEERVSEMFNVIDRVKTETGRTVVYACNITAPAQEMLRRAEMIKSRGGKCMMIDIITAGWSGLQFMRKQNLGLAIHAHRAMHAAFTRDPEHGISMKVIAKLSRLAGVTGVHTGTVVGKMEGDKKSVLETNASLKSSWHGIKKVFPIASGGLYPGLVPELISLLGKDIVFTAGGGLWGHPAGSVAGAIALRQAVDSVTKGIPLKKCAEKHEELEIALKHWK